MFPIKDHKRARAAEPLVLVFSLTAVMYVFREMPSGRDCSVHAVHAGRTLGAQKINLSSGFQARCKSVYLPGSALVMPNGVERLARCIVVGTGEVRDRRWLRFARRRNLLDQGAARGHSHLGLLAQPEAVRRAK